MEESGTDKSKQSDKAPPPGTAPHSYDSEMATVQRIVQAQIASLETQIAHVEQQMLATQNPNEAVSDVIAATIEETKEQ